jgi:hypothetical protein
MPRERSLFIFCTVPPRDKEGGDLVGSDTLYEKVKMKFATALYNGTPKEKEDAGAPKPSNPEANCFERKWKKIFLQNES